MPTNTDPLERLKLILQIAATIAVPVIIAVIGMNVQQGLADKEVSKSYVLMALEILKAAPSKENAELRQWAIEIVDKHSPVPISKALKEQLTNSSSSGLTDSTLKQSFELKTMDGKSTGIVRYVECKKAKDVETVSWLLENYPNQFYQCPKSDEVGISRFTRKGSAEDPAAK